MLVVMAFSEAYVLGDHIAPGAVNQNHIRINHPSRINDKAGTDSTVMTDGAAEYWPIGWHELSLRVSGADWNRKQVEIRKGGAGADEGISSDHTHLQAGILSYS